MKLNRTFGTAAALVLVLPIAGLWPLGAQGPGGGPGPGGGRGPGNNGGLASLKTVPVPQPVGAGAFIRDQAALVALGKALFWDMQTGSDGKTACATCHFHAGADHRVQNQISSPASLALPVPFNAVLGSADFPFHKLSNPNNNNSAVVSDVRQVAGSAGVVHRTFLGVAAGSAADNGADIAGESAFTIAGVKVRQVTARNTPSVINAVFNVRNFWDGRASRIFTGATPFGDSDTSFNALVDVGGVLQPQQVRIDNASLASQSVGPPVNSLEMSYDGRSWQNLGKKMVSLVPLAKQPVAADDSVLGPMANPGGNGLQAKYTYSTLIQAAFQPAYWSSTARAGAAGEFSQMEFNFSIFWGLAIQAYETTLVSDNTRVDQFLEGNRAALTADEQAGMRVFQNGGSQCTQCHQGPEFTAASFGNANRPGARVNNPGDNGFFRTGVSPIVEDIGLGGVDGFGQPLFPGTRPGTTNGLFKSPGLRNVELTGPYFHDGGQATLEQVVDFYGRNGDFPQGGNLGVGIGRINLGPAANRASLVAFLKALTDDRVRFERAPFDHPALCVPAGAAESSPGVPQADSSDPQLTLSAVDKWALIPAVGKNGEAVPLQTFEELLLGIGNDGSRAHPMTQSCTP